MNSDCQYRFEDDGSDVSTARRKSCDYWRKTRTCVRAGFRFYYWQAGYITCFFVFHFYIDGELMKTLEEKIIEEGKILDGNVLKVGSFLNQRLDVEFLMSMGDEVARLFAGEKIDKVLTVEASGIPFAVCVAHKLGVPAVYAKKGGAQNVSGDV